MRRATSAIAAVIALGLSTAASGCAGPLVVSAGQTRGDEVKFAYTRIGSGDQGIIECTVPQGHGDVQDCKHMQINFED